MSRINALEAIRFPACVMLTGSGVLLIGLLPILITHQFGEASRLIRDSALSLHLLLGICLAVFLSGAVSRRRTAQSGVALILSKPIGRELYFISVFAGLLVVEMLFSVCMTLATCMAVASSPESFVVRWDRLVPLMGALLAALCAGGWLNYRRQWNFCSVTVCVLLAGLIAAWCYGITVGGGSERHLFVECIQAGLLNGCALFVFLGLAVSISLTFGFQAAVSVCGVLLGMGLLSDYFTQSGQFNGLAWRILPACTPNWQRFWVADQLKDGGGVSWNYIGLALLYAFCYTLFVLLWCVRRFRRVEIQG